MEKEEKKNRGSKHLISKVQNPTSCVLLLCCHGNFFNTKQCSLTLDDFSMGCEEINHKEKHDRYFFRDFDNDSDFFVFHLLYCCYFVDKNMKDERKNMFFVISGGRTRLLGKEGVSESSSYRDILKFLYIEKGSYEKFFEKLERKMKNAIKIFENAKSKGEIPEEMLEVLNEDHKDGLLDKMMDQISNVKLWLEGKLQKKDKLCHSDLLNIDIKDVILEENARDSPENILFGLTSLFNELKKRNINKKTKFRLKICSWAFKRRRFSFHFDCIRSIFKSKSQKNSILYDPKADYLGIGIPPTYLNSVKGDYYSLQKYEICNFGESGSRFHKKIKRDFYCFRNRFERVEFMKTVENYFQDKKIKVFLDDEDDVGKWVDKVLGVVDDSTFLLWFRSWMKVVAEFGVKIDFSKFKTKRNSEYREVIVNTERKILDTKTEE